jgi:hypothetical protein
LQIRFRVRRPPWWLWLALLLAAIMATYVFIVSAGHWKTPWPIWNTNYDLIAEGFRSGHLYIPVAPPAALLASRNPWDPANFNLWFLDASLYKGHYYLYWGPLPAILLLVVKVVLRLHDVIGDNYVLFAFYTLFLGAGTVLIARMTIRLFPQLSRGIILIATVALAYASPTTYQLATAGIYQAAIVAAQALLLLGLVIAFEAVWKAGEVPPHALRLLAAGACWAAAVASRVSAILPVSVFVALTALFATRDWRDWRRLLVRAIWLSVPIAVTLVLLGVYNKERFDSWFEIGARFQLNTFPFTVSRKFVWLDIYSYLVRPLGHSCRFPFLSALYDIGARGFPKGTIFPPGYTTHEPQAGLFVTSPWTWLLAAALGFAIERAVRWRRAGSPSLFDEARTRAHLWCLGCFAALSFLMPVVFISAFGTTMRYVADFSTGFVLLSTWGAWMSLARLRAGWPRGLAIGVLVLLAVATLVIGMLIGFEGYDDTFRWHNPALWESLRRKLDFCS